MFDMSVLTAAIVYSTLGLVVGILVATGVFYAFTYSKIKHKNTQLRDACLLYQKQLTQLLNKNKALEIQVREVKQRWEKEQQQKARVETAEAERNAAETDQERLAWNQERQLLQQQSEAVQNQLEQLQQERKALEQSLTQANSRWKQEREQLKRSNEQLEQQLAKLRTEAASPAPAVSAADAGDAAVKLHEQQAAWKRAQLLLQQQINKLKTDKKALETELVSQVGQAEREKQALEDEIELLTERMMKLQMEQESLNQEVRQVGVR